MKKDKRFFYDFEGARTTKSQLVTLVSEVKLPEFSKKYEGICAYKGYTNFKKIVVGTKLTLAFGDPRILEDVILISKKRSDAPKDIQGTIMRTAAGIFTFEYQSKRFWVEPTWICRLEDLEKFKK
ncbi:MAG: hypothetical protein WCW78_02650 [Candidatus Paceibacterota bacterium]|jgi:hypothetical protein